MIRFSTTSSLAAAAILLLATRQACALAIPTVLVGNPGNAADSQVMNDGTSGYGSVPNSYRIGTYEVTAGQYTEFLNAVAATDQFHLYSNFMVDSEGCQIQQTGSAGNYTYSVPADYGNRPVNNVDFWDAARFANWLNNGQPTTHVEDATTTEDGAYALNGYTGADGSSITRKPGAKFFIPTENEWYKAAYHKNDGVTGNYWDYPAKSDAVPINSLPDPGNHANYYDTFHTGNSDYSIGAPYYRTEVGIYANSASPYSTFDQGGNVWEWNETVVTGSFRGLRGGGWNTFYDGSNPLASDFRHREDPTLLGPDIGFRIASVIPEPSSMAICLLGLAVLGLYRSW